MLYWALLLELFKGCLQSLFLFAVECYGVFEEVCALLYSQKLGYEYARQGGYLTCGVATAYLCAYVCEYILQLSAVKRFSHSSHSVCIEGNTMLAPAS